MLPDIDNSDQTLEKAWEDSEALRCRSLVKDSTPPCSPMKPAGQPFDSVQPLKNKPILTNMPKSVLNEKNQNERPMRDKVKEPQYRIRTELFREGAEEEIADQIFKQRVELTPEEITTISPKVRRILMHKTQNKRVKPQNRLSQPVSGFSRGKRGRDPRENPPSSTQVHTTGRRCLPGQGRCVRDTYSRCWQSEGWIYCTVGSSGSISYGHGR